MIIHIEFTHNDIKKNLFSFLAFLFFCTPMVAQEKAVNTVQKLPNDSLKTSTVSVTNNAKKMNDSSQHYQKKLQDFIATSQKDMLFSNGFWFSIGEQKTDEAILEKGLEFSNNNIKNVTILATQDDEVYRYILFNYQGGQKFVFPLVAVYSKKGFHFRTYNAWRYKNEEHTEIIGK